MNYKQQLIQKFFDFENWFIRGAKDNFPLDYARELMKLHHEDINAYYHYRNEVYRLIKKIVKDDKVLKDFNCFIGKLQNLYPEQIDLLIQFYSADNISNLYTFKRNNVIEISDMLRESISITQLHLHLYLNYYEIELPLLVLSSAAKLFERGILDLELQNLKDRSGRLKKGYALRYVLARIENFIDLKFCLEQAYNSNIRNAIGHNDYKIKDNRLVSFDNKIIVSKEEFFNSLYYIQEINNSLINTMSTASVKNKLDSLKDCGILGIGFAWEEDKPSLILFQLWCFYELDNSKKWLVKVIFKILGEEILTTLNDRSNQRGPFVPRLKEWFDSLVTNKNQLMVEVKSIVPILEDAEEIVELEGNSFQVIESQSKVIKASIFE